MGAPERTGPPAPGPCPFSVFTLIWLAAALVAVGFTISAGRVSTLIAIGVAIVVGTTHVVVLGSYLSDHFGIDPALEAIGLGCAAIGLAGVATRGPAHLWRSPVVLVAPLAGLVGPLGMWLGLAALVRIERTGEKGKLAARFATTFGVLWVIATVVLVIAVRIAGSVFQEVFDDFQF